METAIEQSTKRKRVAKNRKKAWRKHSNIQDVEDFLEDQRMQLRTGGIVADKPDENLFFVDKEQPSQDEDKPQKKKKKTEGLEKPLKIDRRLMPDPRIPVARKSKTARSSLQSKRQSKLFQRLQKEDKWGPTTSAKRRKLEAAKLDSKRANEEKDQEDKRREVGRATYDIWGDTAPVDGTETKRKKAPEVEPNEHFLRVTKKTRKKLPKTYYDRPSLINAVEVVHPGASYNPTFEDHQELIKTAYEIELEKKKEQDKLDRWHQFKKSTRKEMEKNFMSEMTAGLFVEGDDKEKEAAVNDEDGIPTAPVMAERRKTKRQRRKEKELKEQNKKARAEKASKIRMNEVYRLRAIKRELDEADDAIAGRVRRRKAKAAENVGKTKKLGRYKYEELPIPLKLGTQLVGSLRQLKPEVNLIVDRYNSLQKRNLVEPRIWKKGTKPKMKEYEKKSFKQITE